MAVQESADIVVISAFLHDIGKFLQRAGIEPDSSFDTDFWLSQLCHLHPQGYYTYRHAMLTAYFIERWLPEPPGLNKDSIFHLAAYHHRPCNDHWLDWVIVAADWIASGAERYDEVQEEAHFRQVRLHPVFALVGLDGHQPDPADVQWDYPLKALGLEEAVLFPEVTRRVDFKNDFSTLWEDFRTALPQLPKNSFPAYFNGLFSLMYRYTWCVPSASNVYPDISLFDHSRVTAALAVCLYEYRDWIQERLVGISPDRLRQLDDVEPFLLVKGELSGIQSYIYRIARTGTGGIAKRLRGRSFYLQIFNHQVARLLLRRLGLSVAHLIYCGGGNFLLILPNTERVHQELQRWMADVEEYLWIHHLGELKFRMASKALSPKAIFDGLSRALQDLELGLMQARFRHFQSLFREGGAIEKEKPWESLRPCPSCRIQVIEGTGELCETCGTQQRDVGDRLPRVDGVVFSARTPSSGLPGVGVDWKKLGETRLTDVDQLRQAYSGPDTMEAAGFNRPELAPQVSCLFVANVVPKNKADRTLTDIETERDDEENPTGEVQPHQVFSFSTIASWSEGDARLGVLRMDADRMGAVIAEGLNHHGLMSFSRMATLSRQLQLFFEGWVGTICKIYTDEEWRPKVSEGRIPCDYADAVDSIFYVVYSGGDDLFIIGPWSEMLPLALRIADDYRRFTCENPNMTVSAGLIVCKPKFPIPAMARLSGEAEGFSKDRGRNRVTAFGTTVPWESTDHEWGLRELLELADRWAEWIRSEAVPRRFFHELLRLQAQAVAGEEIKVGMWIPRLIYKIHRNISDEAIAAELHHTLLGRSNSLTLMRVLRLPVSIALLKTRS